MQFNNIISLNAIAMREITLFIINIMWNWPNQRVIRAYDNKSIIFSDAVLIVCIQQKNKGRKKNNTQRRPKIQLKFLSSVAHLKKKIHVRSGAICFDCFLSFFYRFVCLFDAPKQFLLLSTFPPFSLTLLFALKCFSASVGFSAKRFGTIHGAFHFNSIHASLTW